MVVHDRKVNELMINTIATTILYTIVYATPLPRGAARLPKIAREIVLLKIELKRLYGHPQSFLRLRLPTRPWRRAACTAVAALAAGRLRDRVSLAQAPRPARFPPDSRTAIVCVEEFDPTILKSSRDPFERVNAGCRNGPFHSLQALDRLNRHLCGGGKDGLIHF
jgi:hypothetical protein